MSFFVIVSFLAIRMYLSCSFAALLQPLLVTYVIIIYYVTYVNPFLQKMSKLYVSSNILCKALSYKVKVQLREKHSGAVPLFSLLCACRTYLLTVTLMFVFTSLAMPSLPSSVMRTGIV